LTFDNKNSICVLDRQKILLKFLFVDRFFPRCWQVCSLNQFLSTAIIIVHGGVGPAQEGIEKLCADALRDAGLDAVKAVMFLERDGITNCGVGSSLNESGNVECEASYMSSDQLIFGSIGALSNCAHPSLLAKQLAQQQLHNDYRLIPPLCVAGQVCN
jgi:hypothetical protein